MVAEQRRYERVAVNEIVSTQTGSREEKVIDVSEGGCQLRSPFVYPIGELLMISFGIIHKFGVVRWKNEVAYGVEFGLN